MGRIVMPVGCSGSGKSSYGLSNFEASEIVCPDSIRLMLCDNELCQDENNTVFSLAHSIVHTRCRRGLTTYFDATNLSSQARKKLVDIAQKYNTIIDVMVFNVEYLDLVTRNLSRVTPRPDFVIEKHYETMQKTLEQIKNESKTGIYNSIMWL